MAAGLTLKTQTARTALSSFPLFLGTGERARERGASPGSRSNPLRRLWKQQCNAMGPDGRTPCACGRSSAAASSLLLSLEIGSPRLLVPLVLPFFFLLIILKVDHLPVDDDDLLPSSSRARPSASEDSSDKDGGGGQLILSRAHSLTLLFSAAAADRDRG